MKKIILLLFLFLFSCSNEYINYHKQNQDYNYDNLVIQNEIKDFSYESIWYLSWITLKSTPDLFLLQEMVEKIEDAKEKVYVEVYIFTEKRLRNAIIKAHKKWVDVKVLLEKNVYGATTLNNETYKLFEKNWIDVKRSNVENYSLNHTKLMIVDNEAILSTWNYSYSSFKYNREFFLFIKNIEILNKLHEIFKADFSWIKKNIYHNNLILSPFYSREKLEFILKNASESIKIYSLNFSDESIKNILINKQKEWIEVKIIFPDIKKVDSNKEIIQEFEKAWIQVKLLKKEDLHAKSILIDWKYLYIWSINFSYYSINENREIWLLISNEEIIKDFLKIFLSDFDK